MRRWYEHRIPPPVIDAGCAWLMWALAQALPAAQLWPRAGGAWVWGAALGLAALGGAVAMAGVWACRQDRTTINPMAPQRVRVLVTHGVFRHTRNPMYLGMLLVLAGWAVWLGHALAWVGLPLSVALLTVLQIRGEERVLGLHFDPAYAAYRQRVRRWI